MSALLVLKKLLLIEELMLIVLKVGQMSVVKKYLAPFPRNAVYGLSPLTNTS